MSEPGTSTPIVLTKNDHKRLTSLLETTGSSRSLEFQDLMAEELERAMIVPATQVPPNVVTMNSHVTVRDCDSGDTRKFNLVYPANEDSAIGNLSILTPLGVAMIGAVEGDTVSWITLKGDIRKVMIDKVTYQPEADGHFDL